MMNLNIQKIKDLKRL